MPLRPARQGLERVGEQRLDRGERLQRPPWAAGQTDDEARLAHPGEGPRQVRERRGTASHGPHDLAEAGDDGVQEVLQRLGRPVAWPRPVPPVVTMSRDPDWIAAATALRMVS